MQKNISDVMVVTIVVFMLAIAAPSPLFGEIEVEKEPIQVFILAGQSNMEGKGAANTLDYMGEDSQYGSLLNKIKNDDGSWLVRDDVWIWYPARKGKLTIGYGSEGSSHGKVIGPELGFGYVIGDYLENQVLLFKTAWGGKALATDFLPPSAGGPGPFYTKGEELTELKKKSRSRKTGQDNTLPNGLPILHSNPDAPVSIFIDFQFESVDGKARTFSLDKDLMTFNKQEQEHIRLAWAKTASSFAPFDVDVTTIEPHPNHPYIWQAVLNQPGSGGSSGTTGYVPLSGQKTAKNGSQRTDGYRWCGRCAQGSVLTAVITHESGHAHGVSGHETYDENGNRLGIQTAGIERGPFTRSVGPIGRWYNWQSEWGHPDRNPAGIYWVVDDIKVITSQIIKGARTYTNPNYSGDGFRPDEHGNDIAGATKMTGKQTSKSWISSGIIERITDKDVFSFRWPGGTAWIGVRTAVPTPLLDARFLLYDSKGAVVGIADPEESMQAALHVENLAAGTYYIEVSSDGDYSELGGYEVTVSTLMPDSLNLLSYLELNGNSLADSSGHVNKVAWHGSAQWVKGRDGSSAAGFDGSNRITISAGGRSFTPNGLSPLGRTFAFWFKADDVSRTAQQVLCKDARSGYKLYIEDGKLKAHAINDAGLSNWRGGITLTADVSLKSRQWYHAALAHRTTFSEVDDTIALYLNGREAARGPAGPVPGTSRFEVGGSDFTGAIDDVWIFGEMIPGHLIAHIAHRPKLSQPKPTGTAVKTTATVRHNMVNLSWKAVNGATSYKILRSVNNQQFEVAGEVSSGATKFMDTGLQASRSYFYSVRAVGTNAVGTVDVTTRSGPVTRLRFARYTKSEEPDLQWSNPIWGHNCQGKYGIVLNWFEPDGHTDSLIRIERSTDGVNFRPLITLPSTESVYCDHNLASDAEYIYRVVTIDSSGDASSAVISVSTSLRSLPVAGPTS